MFHLSSYKEKNKVSNSYIASVLIPVKNGENYIQESIMSILNQATSGNVEIVVIDDQSTDATSEIVRSMAIQNGNIKLMTSPKNGISNALNFGILKSQSEIIIRLDADDVMQPGRIQSQVNFLQTFPEYVLTGGQIQIFGDLAILPKPNKYPIENKDILRMLCWGNPFAHPTVAFRKSDVINAGLYNPNFDGAEDYELWSRFATIGKLHNSSQILTKYRVHSGQITRKKQRKSEVATFRAQLNILKRSICDFQIEYSFLTLLSLTLRMLKLAKNR